MRESKANYMKLHVFKWLNSGSVVAFSCPRRFELRRAQRKIARLCRGQAAERFGNDCAVRRRLRRELRAIRRTKTAFHFLCLRETVLLLREKGCPLYFPSAVLYSLVAFLLGIVDGSPAAADVDLFTGFNLRRGLCFELRAAEFPDRELQSRLSRRFSGVRARGGLFCGFAIMRDARLDRLKELRRRTGTEAEDADDPAVLKQALETLCEEKEECCKNAPDFAGGNTPEFLKACRNCACRDRDGLVRLCAYIEADIRGKGLEKLRQTGCFATRDELLGILKAHGVRSGKLRETAVFGYSRRPTDDGDTRALERKGVPPETVAQMGETARLLSALHCEDLFRLRCALAWYKVHRREAYAATEPRPPEEAPD